jgi:hypothetical protein
MRFLSIFVLMALIASCASAEMYKNVAPDGSVTYTNKPNTNFKLIPSTTSRATLDIYKRVDGNGHAYYTDQPEKGFNYKLIIKGRPKTYARDLKFMSGNKLKFNDLVARAAAKYQMDPKLLHAVIQAESAYNPHAVSSAGAVGLMQLMPATARRYGVFDRMDAEQNVDAGTRYLKDLLVMFNSNLKLAVAGYNAGEGAVMKFNNTVPPYPETQNYVQQVLKLYGKS